MAFDGVTIAAMVDELHKFLDGGRFNKIAPVSYTHLTLPTIA